MIYNVNISSVSFEAPHISQIKCHIFFISSYVDTDVSMWDFKPKNGKRK